MDENTARRAVVAGVDGSESSLRAARWAAAEAARRRLPLRLVGAYSWPMGTLGDPGQGIDPHIVLREVVLDHLRAAADAAETVAPYLGIERVDVHGSPVPVLQGESASAELVVLGDRGLGGFSGLLIGSVAVELAAHAACPVVVVRGPQPDYASPLRDPVVVGGDGSPTSETAVGFAFDAASFRGVPLIAVHVWRDLLVDPRMVLLVDWEAVESEEREVLAERLAGWTAKYPDVPVRQLVVRDRPAHTLVEQSGRAQLVVVGSRGRGGFTGLLLGSVSQALLHHSRCPVAVVRPVTADGPPAPS